MYLQLELTNAELCIALLMLGKQLSRCGSDSCIVSRVLPAALSTRSTACPS